MCHDLPELPPQEAERSRREALELTQLRRTGNQTLTRACWERALSGTTRNKKDVQELDVMVKAILPESQSRWLFDSGAGGKRSEHIPTSEEGWENWRPICTADSEATAQVVLGT